VIGTHTGGRSGNVADGRQAMLEIFDLSAQDAGLVELWNDAGVGVWAAGAGTGDLPPVFSRRESCLFLQRGRFQLDATTPIEAPALLLLAAGSITGLETSVGPLQAFLWVFDAPTAVGSTPGRRVVLGPADLGIPRTITASSSILHWLPPRAAAERRALAGDPWLALNLGDTPIPMVAGDELVPLAGRHGAIACDVVTLRVIPGSGPVIALEHIAPT